jgi:hypothetical protein
LGLEGGNKMMTRKIVCVFGVLAITFFVYSNGWAQSKLDSKAPIITNSFAIEKGYYGYIWKIYIEAEDPDGDMLKIASTVDQPGWGHYFTDTVLIKSKNRSHFKGYVQWNTFSSNTSYIREFTIITLKVSIIDKAGNESNVVVFPFQFVSRSVPKYELPSPFNKDDMRLGYIHIDLFEPSLSGNAGSLDPI